MADMAIAKREPSSGNALPALAACLAAWAGAAFAAVEVQPQVSLGVSRTDNVSLAPQGQKQSDTIWSLTPSIALRQSSGRFQSSLDYQLQGYYYREHSDSEVFHRLDAQTRVALDEQNFFLDAGAAREQVVRDPSAPVPFGNIALSGNRTDRDDYYLGPSFQYPVGANMTVGGSYRRSWVRYDDVASSGPDLLYAQDYKRSLTQLSLDNHRQERGFAWAVRYSTQETDYEIVLPWEFRQASVELGVLTGDGFRFFATGGKESAWDQPFDPSLEDEFWEAGIAKQAGQRLSVELAAGDRTFGSSRRASLNLGLRRGRMTLSYDENPTTEGRDPYEGGLYGLEPDDLLSRPGLLERYIANRLRWNLSLELRRSTLSLSLYDESREERYSLTGVRLPDETQTGADVSLSFRPGARTQMGVGVRRGDREFEANDRRVYSSASFNMSYDLGARTYLELRIERSKDEPRGNTAPAGYRANLFSLYLTRRFWTPR